MNPTIISTWLPGKVSLAIFRAWPNLTEASSSSRRKGLYSSSEPHGPLWPYLSGSSGACYFPPLVRSIKEQALGGCYSTTCENAGSILLNVHHREQFKRPCSRLLAGKPVRYK